MDPEILTNLLKKIYQRYPEFRGAKPRVRPLETSSSKTSNHKSSYILTFQKKVKINDVVCLNRSLRIVASSQGKIMKVSTSR